MNKVFHDIEKAIYNSSTIYIASHVNPDGDNLGSSLALYKALRKIKNNVYVLYVDEIPKNYKFLPNIDRIVKHKDVQSEEYLFISIDSADENRLGKNKKIAEKADCLINIDHHLSNPEYGDINLVDANASATGELIYELIDYMEIEFDSEIATCLYTAISSDTGSFMYSNTTSKTHKIIAELYKYEMDVDEINIQLYQSRSLNKTKLFNKSMQDMELYFNNRVGILKVSRRLLEETNTKLEDTEGLVETLRDIDEIELAILLKEEDDKVIKVSTRSKRKVNVAELCSKFGGGGHKRAAGCTINNSIDGVKEKLLKEIELML